MTEISTSTPPVGVRGRWHSATFRLLTTYAVVFSCSVALLLSYIGWTVTAEMERETDVVMDWQLIYFDSLPDSELNNAIYRRIERERMHSNYYGLFAPDGSHLAGDVLAMPSGVRADRTGVTLQHSMQIEGSGPSPVVRAMVERRKDGKTLVIARDLTHILHIRKTIINALVAGGILCLASGVAGGLALSMRQMRRAKEIRRVTQRIAQGDLGQRLPVGGRDELDMLAHLVNRMLDDVERLMNEVKGACDGIAHDLRTPLAHVRTLLSHIAERTSRVDDAAIHDLVERARTETDALLDRFRAMLRISEIGTLQRRGGFGEVELAALVREVGELYEPLAETRAINLTVNAGGTEPVHGDRALLFEMLSNLIDNAIKFTHDGGSVSITLAQTTAGPRIDIVDNGAGIPAEEREAVLQRFYRSERTSHLTGSGLGLSIVSAVIRVHDFTMRIDDEKPGTRVTIECWSRTLA
ncbi:HAMP domain-containing histidine kinase [Paraburkholderia sp. CNPSo 3272]|uniref:sensor histidine kinase n=1 Tax=Paraburkholderia sp. CNPSo 3272 TaxID=2940931 RepID=UPI0020B66A95|nr:HAMP domain-containing sensor histidine kinase [Paraburkholderia sp. CNPSo 3272]MCP3725148.1 HAMP domain-containing histidine kinase [Paraburkholderia sp. CNPSo 3272]